MEAEVLFEYRKENPDELDLKIGEIITNVTEVVDDGWCEGTKNGERGMFPDNFVRLRPSLASSD
ncbi:SH3 domain-containing kinase-binding protein 1, partial [Geodia barretti]